MTKILITTGDKRIGSNKKLIINGAKKVLLFKYFVFIKNLFIKDLKNKK